MAELSSSKEQVDRLIRTVNACMPTSVNPSTRIEIHPSEWLTLVNEISDLRERLMFATLPKLPAGETSCGEPEPCVSHLALREYEREITAMLDLLGADAIRVREGGGPENLLQSLAVTLASMRRPRVEVPPVARDTRPCVVDGCPNNATWGYRRCVPHMRQLDAEKAAAIAETAAPPTACDACKGRGEVRVPMTGITQRCTECRGTGVAVKTPDFTINKEPQ